MVRNAHSGLWLFSPKGLDESVSASEVDCSLERVLKRGFALGGCAGLLEMRRQGFGGK